MESLSLGKQQEISALFDETTDSLSCLRIAKEIAKDCDVVEFEKFLNVYLQKSSSKSGFEREASILGISALIQIPKFLPIIFPHTPLFIDLQADKGLPIREAGLLCLNEIIKGLDDWSIWGWLPWLMEGCKGKWQGKITTLELLVRLTQKFPLSIADYLPEIIPHVTNCMHDTKREVSTQAFKTMQILCKLAGNPDIDPHIPLLIECMQNPDNVSKTVSTLSSTTFVAEVTGPALSLIVPLLVRALNDRSASVMRPTVVIANNLFKLVRNPPDAGQFMNQLLPGLDRIIETAAFPEIRDLAQQARSTLVEAAGGETAVGFQVDAETVLKDVNAFCKNKKLFLGPIFKPSISFFALMISRLVGKECYRLAQWEKSLQDILETAIPKESKNLIAILHENYHSEYMKTQIYGDDDDDEGELLCDLEFSLAYGGMMLLNNTRLRLRRGQRYGLCGANGAGKSTLMRAISLGKVDGFPTQDQLKCVFVEHTLQGDEAELSVIEFLAKDPQLKGKKRAKIADILEEVGFTPERQAVPVGSLSGGWKMKLELARAMIIEADILLLDEPTNHLDVANVKWLENYLNTHPQITSLIVSHDSGFLDNVCTFITHYEKKKLVYYKGNLEKFVERRPEAKSYYTLAATSVKFSFPPPSVLLGIRSNTKAIMKMTDCVFTYPGAAKPSMYGVSVSLSLSSRVGVVGANGAGKSTMIKLLTGELIPQQGTVWKHPNIRVGYVAQHAFHHLEQHLEKTPNQYIQWRYQGGQDREVLEKASRKLTEEDIIQMEKTVVWEGVANKIELLLGRQKLKKSFQYEVKWVGKIHKYNKWLPRETLLELGFQKMVQAFDDREASREGQGYRELIPSVIREHIEQVGLPGDIADHNQMSGLSGGQKVKVVLAAAMWNNPHMLVLDEPTNYLDRESLGGLAVAIKEWGGAVVMISHNTEFVESLCPELWHIDAGKLVKKGIVETKDEPEDGTSFEQQAEKIAKTVSKSSGKKKKLSRNELKAREVRRRARHLKWLSEGGQKEADTDEDE